MLSSFHCTAEYLRMGLGLMTFSLFLTSDADPGAKGRLDGHAGDVHDIAHIGAAPRHFGRGGGGVGSGDDTRTTS